MRRNVLSVLFLTAALAASCATPGAEQAESDRDPDPAQNTAAPDRGRSAAQGASPGPAKPPSAAPQVPFADAQHAFEKARKDLLEGYHRDDVGEEQLYRAALQGMLEHLDPAMKGWHKLLSPAELAELNSNLQGELVGIGAEIRFDPESGYTDVLGLLPRSAAERAGLLPGDKIVTVDGKLFKGSTQAEVIAKIRGKIGEPVVLSVLRGDKLVEITVTRDRIALDVTTHFMASRKVGYLLVRGFSAKTAPAVKGALSDLSQKGAQALVLDLRDNQGGAFDEAIATAGLFLPNGTPVVVTKKRGDKRETAVSKGEPILGQVPLKVLVNEKTASGAELVAGALQEARKAELIGERTFGKWSVQIIDELGNGWAIKFTVGLFETPGGRSFEGEGLSPDIEVDMDDRMTGRILNESDPAKRLAADGQLRTAVGLLEGR